MLAKVLGSTLWRWKPAAGGLQKSRLSAAGFTLENGNIVVGANQLPSLAARFAGKEVLRPWVVVGRKFPGGRSNC